MPRKSFEDWKKDVDAAIARNLYGLTSDDLPDYGYRDAYDDGESATATARAAIRAAEE